MLEGKFEPLRMRVVVVDVELSHDTAEGRAARLLVEDLEARNLDVIPAISAADGMSAVTSDAAIHAVLMDWTLDDDDAKTHDRAQGLLKYIRNRNERIPIFLMAERKDSMRIPVDVMQSVDEFVWTLEDTASFVSDVLRCHIETNGRNFKDITLREAMTTYLVVAELEDDLSEIMAVMTDRNIRHLPVVDKGALIGMLSVRDVIQSQVQKLTSEIHYLKDYIASTLGVGTGPPTTTTEERNG